MLTHFRGRIITGLLILTPLVATVIILRVLFGGLANILEPAVNLFWEGDAPFIKSLVSLAILFGIIYLTGLFGSNLVGHWFISLFESLIDRVPLVNRLYGSVKKVVHVFNSQPEKSFEKVVWVKFPTECSWSIGFVTGAVRDSSGNDRLKVFVPTAPNPTSGFLIIVTPEDAVEANMAVEAALQMVLSGGIVSPDSVSI